MKKRVMSGWVTVTGPPCAIWRRKIGITDPDEPSTLPNRTATNARRPSARWPYVSTIHSHSAFDAPITVCGLAALSVEMSTNRSTRRTRRRRRRGSASPSVLLRTASSGFGSIIGTCLYAAAWKTTSGR